MQPELAQRDSRSDDQEQEIKKRKEKRKNELGGSTGRGCWRDKRALR